jgi:subtilisin family serine protease
MGENSYVCSPGYNFGTGSGTSYATPILAGAVACLWQANPAKTNMEILQALKATASKASNPDNNYGWGIPNVCAAHNLLNGTTLGVKDIAHTGTIKLFPNPAKSELNFKLEQKPVSVKVTDVLGKTITVMITEKGSDTWFVNLNDMANGVYFISVKTADGSFNSRFVKE